MGSIFDERLEVNAETKSSLIYNEHIARYELARAYVKGKTVLEAACGSGYGAYLLAAAGAKKVFALDIDEVAVELAAKRYHHENINFLTDNVESLSRLAEASIDVVVSFETIEHLGDYQAYARNLRRVLRPDGLAVISTPNREVFGQKNPFHLKEFNRQEFIELWQQYFKKVVILEQYNALASVIKTEAATTEAIVSQPAQTLYFIAVVSDVDIALPPANIISLNQPALLKWQGNVAWRMVNKLYGLLARVGVIR